MKYETVKLDNGKFKVVDADAKTDLTIELETQSLADAIRDDFNEIAKFHTLLTGNQKTDTYEPR